VIVALDREKGTRFIKRESIQPPGYVGKEKGGKLFHVVNNDPLASLQYVK
jgi:hypothetical protein